MLANTRCSIDCCLGHRTVSKKSVSLDFDNNDDVGVKLVVGKQQFMEELRIVNFQGVSGYLKIQNDSTRKPKLVACNLCCQYTKKGFVIYNII